MFVRTVETRAGSKTHRYLRVVENYRADGKVKQRVILNLGNLEKIRPGLPVIAKALSRYSGTSLFNLKEINCEKAREYGNILLLKKLWKDLGMETALHDPPFPEGEAYIMAMVFQCLLSPRGNLSLHQWLQRVYLPDLDKSTIKIGGRQRRPCPPQAGFAYPFGEPPTSKKVLALFRYMGKEGVQRESFKRLKDCYKGSRSHYLISCLPAITGSTESQGLSLAVLSAGGIPRSFTLYGGKADSTFIREILQGLGKRKAIFVCHGFNLKKTSLNFLRKRGISYMVFYGVRKSVGIDNLLSRRGSPSTWRIKIRKGRGQRLYMVHDNSSQEGKPHCVFRTNIPGRPSASDAIRAYRELLEWENALGEIRPPSQVLSHEVSKKGYIWMCFLAYALKKILAKRLLLGGIEMTPLELLERLKDIKIVTNRVAGERLNYVTRIARRDRELLSTLGIGRLRRTTQPHYLKL
ncbi:MAG: hypothetical protein Q6354_07575 [Candidatus Brocadiales bacterium]|nr:hypothetical protein [Candidatus Brocadiales bacterium]